MRVRSILVAVAAFTVVALRTPAYAAPSVFTMNPNPLDVGTVVVGQTGTAEGTLSDTNNEHINLVVTNNCTGGNIGTFTVTPDTDIDIKDPVTITASYTPSARGTRRCRVDIYKTGQSSRIGSFDVRGTGQDPPRINVTGATTLAAVRFNDAAPVHTSQQTYTVTNQGDLALVISAVTIGGTDMADFTLASSALPGPIPRNNTASWTVVFDPSAAGTRTATLTFTSNDPATPNRVLNLQGDGQTGVISVDDRAFGTVNVGSNSTLDITVANIGGAPKGRLGVTTAAITGGSWFTFSACGGGTTCTFNPALSIQNAAPVGVRCSPPITASPNDVQSATVTFTSDSDAAANAIATSQLSCTAGKGALETSSASVAFPSQLIQTAAPTQMLTVRNTGNAPTTFYLALTGAGAPSYAATVMGKTCGTGAGNTCPLAIGGMETVVVTFTPGTEADIVAGLDVVSPATPFPQLTLAGRGIDRHIAVAPAIAFPDTFRNPGDQATVMPVTVKNVGEYPLHVSGIEVLGQPGWSLAETTTTFDVPGLGSHDVMVRFSPETAGKAPDGTLIVTSDDRTNATMMVTLTGNGKDRRVQLAPTAIDLGDTGAGVPTRLSILHPDGLLTVENHDADHAFQIRAIEIEGDPVFQIEGLATDEQLPASGTKRFDIVFAPPGIGEFEATAVLYLDQDPTPQVSVPLHGRSLFVDARGGGGCNAGRSSGGAGLVLVLGAVALARRRRAALLAATALVPATAAVPATAHGEPTRNLQLSVFEPTPSTTEAPLQLVPATVGPSGQFAVSVLASYASNPLVLGTVQADDSVVGTQLMTRIGVAYAFARRFEAGLSMPFYVQSGDTLEPGQLGSPPASGTARGDLALHLKAAAVATPRFALGVALAGTVPTASSDQFAGSEKASGRGFVTVTLAPSPHLHVHLNAGAVLRARAAFANVEQKSAAAGGAGVSLRMTGSLTLAGEVFGTRTAGGYHAAPAPGETMGPTEALTTIEALASARLQLGRSLSLTVGGGRGVTSSVGSPDLRGVVALAFVPTARAAPPKLRVAVEPAVPVDPSQRDTDRDRVADPADRCPNDPEDRDRFEDDDGCPDLDNDKDGVADASDTCPEPEDRDGFEDDDGCPDLDNDKDGLADANDKCPGEAETINGMADNDGCPDTGAPLVMSTPERLELVESIAFRGATITDASTNVLSQLGATLRARTDILKIRITAHVQPSKSPRADKKLSERRAAAVKQWLLNFGIEPARLDVRGMGGTTPLVKPSSKGAAQVNDRVEFIIIDRG